MSHDASYEATASLSCSDAGDAGSGVRLFPETPPPPPSDRVGTQGQFTRLGLVLARLRIELEATESTDRRKELFAASTSILEAMDQMQEIASRVFASLTIDLAAERNVDVAAAAVALGKSLSGMQSAIAKQRAALRALQPVAPKADASVSPIRPRRRSSPGVR